MSVVPSSDFSNSSSRVASGIQPDVLSRLHVRIVIDKSMLASVVADVVRLADVLLPDTAHFLVTENDSITLRVRDTALHVYQADILSCRLARCRGVRLVEAEQKAPARGIMYQARLRGRP